MSGRLMSVAYTEDAVVARTKTVSRRLGWKFVKKGDRLWLCRKVMGRKKGEPLVRLAYVEVIDVCRERLDRLILEPYYGQLEMRHEGFPEMDPHDFIKTYFIDAQRRSLPATGPIEVTRIEWRYIE